MKKRKMLQQQLKRRELGGNDLKSYSTMSEYRIGWIGTDLIRYGATGRRLDG
jgi:hypothetical protein